MSKILDKLMNIVEGLVAALIALVIVFITLQVIWRYVLRDPLTWTEQTSRYIFVWICMLGVPVAFHKGASFEFDLIVKTFPRFLQGVVFTIISLINIFFCGYWAYWTYRLIAKVGWRLTEGVVVPMGYLYAGQIACAVLLGLVFINQTIVNAKKYFGKEVTE